MAVDPNVLLNEVSCLNCNSNASLVQLLELAFLQRIDASGGGGGGGTPDLPLNSVQFNEAGAFGGSNDLTWRNFATIDLNIIGRANAAQIGITGYSLTAANAQSMLNFSGTWNTTGNPVALRLAITDTASGATSKFLEFLGGAAGATSFFSVDKIGNVNISGLVTAGFGLIGGGTSQVGLSYFIAGVQMGAAGSVRWGAGDASAADTSMERQAAGIIEVNNGTTGTYRDLWARHLRLATPFTVAALPVAGVQGRMAYVTDALTPTFLTLAVGGGAVIAPVFDNGTNWVTV